MADGPAGVACATSGAAKRGVPSPSRACRTIEPAAVAKATRSPPLPSGPPRHECAARAVGHEGGCVQAAGREVAGSAGRSSTGNEEERHEESEQDRPGKSGAVRMLRGEGGQAAPHPYFTVSLKVFAAPL